MTAPHGCPGCTCPVATDPAAFHDDDCGAVTADEAAPTPDVPDEAVRAGADGFMRAEREPMYHPSEGPPLQSTQDVAHAVLEGVLADPDARAALLAALGHTDCEEQINDWMRRAVHHDGERDWEARRAERAEAERDRYRALLSEATDTLIDVCFEATGCDPDMDPVWHMFTSPYEHADELIPRLRAALDGGERDE